MNQTEYGKLALIASKLRPTLAASLLEISLQLLILLVGFWFSTLSLPFWITGQMILGLAFWRSFAILHACGHHAFSSRKTFDDVIGLSQSLFCFVPYYSWKFIHFDHHRWTGWLDKDPTMKNLQKTPSQFTIRALNFCWKFWVPLISFHYIVTVFFAENESYRKRPQVYVSMFLVFLFHGVLVYHLGWAYFRFFGLSSFIYLNLGDLSLLTQHVHLPMDHSQGEDVEPKKLWEQDRYSHTVNLPIWMSRWIVLGFNYHSFHHLFPTVPYYLSENHSFEGEHTHEGKTWLLKAKGMKASDLIFKS